MEQITVKSLTFAEFGRKYNLAKYVINRYKDQFEIDPGFDTEKIYDNSKNKATANKIKETRQVRPNSIGKSKPRIRELS